MKKKIIVVGLGVLILGSVLIIPTIIIISMANNPPSWIYTTDDEVASVDISANGEWIVANSIPITTLPSPRNLMVFKKESATIQWTFPISAYPSSGMRVAISADGNYIAATDFYETIYLFDTTSGTQLWNYTTTGAISTIAISHNGDYIAVGGHVGPTSTTRIYLFNKLSPIPIWNTTDFGYQVDISSNGEYIISANTEDMYLFHRSSANPVVNYSIPLSSTLIYSAVISSDASRVAVGYHDYHLAVYPQLVETQSWNYHTNGFIYDVDISGDGSYIVAGSGDDNVYLFDSMSSIPLWTYQTGDEVWSVAISEDGNYIVAGSDDDSIYLFNRNFSSPLEIVSTNGNIRTVEISDNGRYSIAGNSEGEIFFLDRDNPYFTIDYLSFYMTFIQYYAIISALMIAGLVISTFTLRAIRKRREVYKEEILEEERLSIEFIESLDKEYKKWDEKNGTKKED
ncbi:MAG: hypothetical protein EU539_11555 [Promethearchaeota archaeon]|nr:MAG: hypothetical protein EU539_11555 [Candidatus Lokiarchaeota archaeon]